MIKCRTLQSRSSQITFSSSPYQPMFTSLLASTFIGVALVHGLGLTDSSNLFKRNVISSGCPANGPVSCQNTTVESNLCCFESPGVRFCFPFYLLTLWLMVLLDFRVYCYKLRQAYSACMHVKSDHSLVLGHQSVYWAK